ncbi:MAG: hypothetical protein BWY57_02616 [Betaproteobacteria bacterium ADurb.Bin341]|nr:MAG: hypothetical protein BWY57_02616 [Betaproteobacteria bacterium ADurb.Bin341]
MNGFAGGLWVHCASPQELGRLEEIVERYCLTGQVSWVGEVGQGVLLSLLPALRREWVPDDDSTGLAARLSLDTVRSSFDLEREILIALLVSPLAIEFPSCEELLAAIHIRRNIVLAGRRTALDFHTSEAERPADCWRYDEENGYVVRPGHSLIEALRKATQPGADGQVYSFSCYRATEYVILLAIAEELLSCNPELYDCLQRQCERRVIRSGQFHEVFLREYGAQESPMPERYYVPGDRVWFRNPDERSSDVLGNEGSWVLYLGSGLFTNFWKRDQPYTLDSKCLEIYHWRNGVCRAADGELAMDEAIVEQRVAASLREGDELSRILDEMMRLRAPSGCYGQGGCIDTTREGPRWVCPGTSDLHLPPV